jgi:acetyltransferase-like isoleucine patch superfamily enzyme
MDETYTSQEDDVLGVQMDETVMIGEGAKLGLQVKIDQFSVVGRYTIILGPAQIGQAVFIGDRCLLQGRVEIEDSVMIQNDVFILVSDAKNSDQVTKICKRAGVGEGSLLKAGIMLGQGSLVAPNSVVLDDVPAYTFVRGNPAVKALDIEHN